MKLSLRVVSVLVVALVPVVTGCSKLSSSGEAGSTKTTATSLGGGSISSADDVLPALTKAGWTVVSDEADDRDGWPSHYVKLEKGKDDDTRSATLFIDALGQGEGGAKAHVEVGKGALIRFAFRPTPSGKDTFDVAAFAKDIVGVTPPEKATDGLFNSSAYDKTVAKHGLTGASNQPGGRLSPAGVVFNHRTPNTKGGGSVAIEIVHYQKSLEEGATKLYGTTLVSVTGDDAVRKEIFATLGK